MHRLLNLTHLLSLHFNFAFAYTALANGTKFFAEGNHELVSVDNTLGVQLINVGAKHFLQGGTQSVLGELEVLVNLQKVLHLFDRDSSLIIGVHRLEH
jgi:hypothetical protein